jgi:alpha-glucosidase
MGDKIRNIIFLAVFLIGGVLLINPGKKGKLHLESPDGRLQLLVTVSEQGMLRYTVRYDGKEVVLPSRLGLVTGAGDTLGTASALYEKSKHTGEDGWWRPVYGDRSRYRDHYNDAIITLKEPDDYKWQVQFRAYNEGLAFRYYLLQRYGAGDTVTIHRELTGFVFPAGSRAWVTYSAQGKYSRIPVQEIKRPAERPLVVEEPGDTTFVAVGEAALVDYARMRLGPDTTGAGVTATLAGEVQLLYPAETPWRYVMVGRSAGALVENNFLLLNLNEPCALEDVSWIRPGKVIREVTLTTRGGKACINFAASHGLQFVEYDAGWYGHEYTDTSDATTVTVDPDRSPGPLDLQEVIRYGKEKGIGIILYVNRRALEHQLDTLLPLYESWGISGVKYGFVRVGPLRWTAWLHEAVRKAADHHLMVDVHDEYRPTGYQRTYPNFMTCEGVRGDEEAPDNHHTLITMFTRTIAGPADNTVCYFTERVTGKMRSSHASQLAKAVCIYSPWQFLFWYDRPAESKGDGSAEPPQNGVISDVPELSFFRHVPTVWDETRVLEGKIGEYGTFLRRSGREWYLGSINGEKPHTITVPLSFLHRGPHYWAVIYSDDPQTSTRTHVKIEVKPVTPDKTLTFSLEPNTGLAIRFVPEGGRID